MNNYISFETIDLAKKLKGYNMLFNYRMSNLCVKAEPTALMPVTVFVAGTEYNLEDVANILRPDDFSFDVYPKNQNNLQDIITGVLDAHPEFKMELKTDKAEMEGGADTQHVFYTMPPVDKDRRKLLNETTKTFHKDHQDLPQGVHGQPGSRLCRPAGSARGTLYPDVTSECRRGKGRLQESL